MISEGAYALLERLTRHVTLVAACEQAQAEVPAEAAKITENLGLVVSLHVFQ